MDSSCGGLIPVRTAFRAGVKEAHLNINEASKDGQPKASEPRGGELQQLMCDGIRAPSDIWNVNQQALMRMNATLTGHGCSWVIRCLHTLEDSRVHAGLPSYAEQQCNIL